MNPIILSLMRVLSHPDINIKKHYKIFRPLINVRHFYPFKRKHRIWDSYIKDGNREIPLRFYAPKSELASSVILFFHGGGWVLGSIDSYDKVCITMAEELNQIVVSVSYRLAPEYPFPDGLMDCYKVARELFSKASVLGIDEGKITLMGDSAGGNLVASVSQMARDKHTFFPKKQILLYPATYNNYTDTSPFPSVLENGYDYLLTTKKIHDYMELYKRTDKDLENPYFAPLLSKNFSMQPKTLILTAELDPLRDEGEAYGEKLKEAGNEVCIYRMKHALHGFMTKSKHSKEVKKMYQLFHNFLDEE